MFGSNSNSGRQICKFFLEGRCKFGDNCKNEHPRNQGSQQQGFGNRFLPLQNQGSGGFRGRAGAISGATDRSGDPRKPESIVLSEETIRDDLTLGKGRPIWPLSVYSPINSIAPRFLESHELSFEELRVQYCLAQVAGAPQEYVKHEELLLQKTNQEVQKILNDVPGARKYILDNQNQPIDTSVGPESRSGNTNPSTQFQNSLAPANLSSVPSTSFGQPSNLGAGTKPAFGAASSMGQTSTFGQPSAPGGGSAFGQPSALGMGSMSGRPSTSFGQPSTSFGQPSALGGASPFGGGQQQQHQTAFGQASAAGGFGQASSFGNVQQPQQPSSFGQPSAFGARSQPQQASSFGQPSSFGAAANQPSPFAQAAQNQQQQPAKSPFGQPTNNTQMGGFGAQSTNNDTQSSAFGQASGFGAPSARPANPFAAAPSAAAPAATNAQSSNPFGSATTQASTDPTTGYPREWHGKRVVLNAKRMPCYEVPEPEQGNPTKTRLERIWFLERPSTEPDPGLEGPPEAYEGERGAALKAIYDAVRETGSFPGGIMPEVPPKREWIDWDL